MTSPEAPETGRFYTRSRRFPKFIGRLHDGSKIWGGPYTLMQGAVFVVVTGLALLTQSWWAADLGMLFALPASGVIGWGAAYGVGKIPMTRRNILSVIAGGVSAVFKPTAGHYQDRPVKIRPPHRAGGRVLISGAPRTKASSIQEIPAAAQTTPVAAVPVEVTPEPTPAHTAPVSGVERLLQQARGGSR